MKTDPKDIAYQAKLTDRGNVIWNHKEDWEDSIYKREYPNLLDFINDMRDKFGGRFANKIEKDLKQKGFSSNRVSRISNNKQVRLTNRNRNPELFRRTAIEMSEDFHGRKVNKVFDIKELEYEPSNYAVLGDLEELVIQPVLEDKYEYVISFDEKDCVLVCTDADGEQIYFIDGNQDLLGDLSFLSAEETKQRFITVGFVCAITYFTDKHHLEGGKEQEDGVPYEHEFGEQGGEWPLLIFDRENKKMFLSGGTYEVKDVGIWN